MISYLLLLQGNYSTLEIFGVIILSLAIGFAVKSAVIIKQRKRILRLEDEMLANHARILSLEKKIAEHRKERSSFPEFTQSRVSELKVS